MKTRCRYCRDEMEVDMFASLKDILYCSEECWRCDWERNGDGLRHPEKPDVEMRMHPELDVSGLG